MSVEEYWIGKGVDYLKIWQDYLAGKEGYLKKFNSSNYYLMQLKFDYPDSRMPIINQEVISKTIKGCYHDLKQHCHKGEYEEAGPLFSYSVERGSGIFEFLGEFQYLITLSLWLIPGVRNGVIELLREYVENKRLDNEGKHQDNISKTLQNFNSYLELIESAPIPKEIRNNLKAEYLSSLEISSELFKGDINASRRMLKDLKTIEKHAGRGKIQ
jgi:hypothetical protein